MEDKKLKLKTFGKFDTIEEMQEALHNVWLQVNNEYYSHFHRKEDEHLFGKLLENVGEADTMLSIMLENDVNVRRFTQD